VKPRDPAAKPFAFLATPFDDNYGTFSPDGRWIAYVSDESGRQEVYVTAFPSGEGKWRISPNGGSFPRWRRDGQEIVYLAADAKLVAVPADGAGKSFSVSAARQLFEATTVASGPGAPFDMTADGQHLVLNALLPGNAAPTLVVLYKWRQLIARR
jgi:dipeptidyl aminopeptidase/acylaminoacyl peptidase